MNSQRIDQTARALARKRGRSIEDAREFVEDVALAVRGLADMLPADPRPVLPLGWRLKRAQRTADVVDLAPRRAGHVG